ALAFAARHTCWRDVVAAPAGRLHDVGRRDADPPGPRGCCALALGHQAARRRVADVSVMSPFPLPSPPGAAGAWVTLTVNRQRGAVQIGSTFICASISTPLSQSIGRSFE